MRTELRKIEKLYLDGELFENTDEKGADGYWDLASDIAGNLTDNIFEFEQL